MTISMKLAGLAMGTGYRLLQAAMPPAMEVSEDRDRALRAFAARAGQHGWTVSTLRESAGPDADILFAGGRAELAEAWAEYVDREMIRRIRAVPVDEPHLSLRVRNAILTRFEILEPYREAEKRAVIYLASPCAQGVRARILSRTLNAIWEAADDYSTGVTWATKRVSLAGVYLPAFMVWLGGADQWRVERTVDAGLARVRLIGKIRGRFVRPAAPEAV